MKHAFIMDPLGKVKAHKDTSYYLMLAAWERGHDIYYLDQNDIYLDHNQVMARVEHVDVSSNVDKPFSQIESAQVALCSMDIVWIRTDPPMDRRYSYTTLLLDFLPESTRVINRPSGIRNWNEKLAALYYPELTPRSLVSRSTEQLKAFAALHDRITLKPIDGHGGQGIQFITAEDIDIDASINQATHGGHHWTIAQEYLPAAAQGDKRILLLDGEPLGAILRVHADGVELNNMDAGGTPNPSELTSRDLEICAAVKPGLREQGILFAGIDVIGGMLIEINVTSPTGLQELCRFSGQALHHKIVARLE